MNCNLSKREKEVLFLLIAEELSSKAIAERLSISVGTVDTHRKRLLKKTGTNNSVGLTKYALEQKLI